MSWPLVSILAILLTDGRLLRQNMPAPRPGEVRLMAAHWQDQPAFDGRAEKALLDLANRARAQAQLPPFRVDQGLTRAARIHAVEMAERGELSHQFSDEPALAQRIAANCSLYLVEAAENVASSQSVDRAHDGLMHSVHHRENLLHPSYNVAGFGVVSRGDTLYIVQDFGNSSHTLSPQQSESQVSESVDQLRAKARLPALQYRDLPQAHKEACAMAAGDALQPSASRPAVQARHIIRYTSSQPGNLPAAATEAIGDNSVHGYSVGSCFARSASYPNGIYWVVLAFY